MTTIEATAPSPKWVRVFHNNESGSDRGGYQQGQTVTEVDTYLERDAHADLVLVGHVFDLLNIGDDPDFDTPDELAVQYRKAGNRSLSVGDVVGIDSRFYAINPSG